MLRIIIRAFSPNFHDSRQVRNIAYIPAAQCDGPGSRLSFRDKTPVNHFYAGQVVKSMHYRIICIQKMISFKNAFPSTNLLISLPYSIPIFNFRSAKGKVLSRSLSSDIYSLRSNSTLPLMIQSMTLLLVPSRIHS